MDVSNVSYHYSHLIDRQKQTLLQAKKRQGQRPRDRKSRGEAYWDFMARLRSTTSKGHRHMIHSSFVPLAYLPCTAPVAQLRCIMVKDLQLEIHHRGTYLLLRSITPPRRMTAIMAVMEDENGDAALLQLYQQEDEDTRAAKDIVDVGTILLVKEPYYKVMGDGEYGLRVDHLCDIAHLEMGDARIPDTWQPQQVDAQRSAESLKIRGNQAMQETRYWDAIKDYSDALGQPATASEIEILKRNRSLALLRTKQFDAALSDTGFPNFGPNPVEKALFRAAEALYNLERFPECCRVLEQLCKHFPKNTQSPGVLTCALHRSREQHTGVYDFMELQKKAKKLRPPHFDHATYIGLVEIRQAQSKGRGLFVVKAVKAGDLLLCEKAFSSAYVDEEGGEKKSSSKLTLLLNPETNQGFMGAQADLIKLIVQKIYRNPSLARAVTSLHCGNYKAADTAVVDGKPVVDTFLIERIISFNAFGCPVTSLVSHNDTIGKSLDSVIKTKNQPEHHSCGIWPYASYINHSCTSNARRSFIGDMMIVRASRDMDAGTEIVFWYHSPGVVSLNEMQEKLKHWGFICECALCQDAKTTHATLFSKRRKIMEDLKKTFDLKVLAASVIAKIERLLDAASQTYMRPAEEVPRLQIWDAQLALVRVFGTLKNATKVIEWVRKVLDSLGFVLVDAGSSLTPFTIVQWGLTMDHLVETFLHARGALLVMGAGKDSKRATEYARTAYKIIIGEDASFDESYG